MVRINNMKIIDLTNISRPTLLFIGIWIISFIWRPFLLGFYSDDYAIFLEPLFNDIPLDALIIHLKNLFLNRPFTFLLSIFWTTICRSNPALWHISASILSLLIGLCIRNLLTYLNNNNKILTEYEIVLLSALWFVLPFTLGFTAWPTYLFATSCALFFAGFLYYFLKSNGSLNKNLFISLFLYFLSISTLEAFYFQYIIGFGLVYLNSTQKQDSLKKMLFPFIVFTAVQISIIFITQSITTGVRKSFDMEFIVTRIVSVINNPQYLFEAIVPITFLTISMLLFIYLFIKIKKNGLHKIDNNLLCVCLILTGIIMNIIIYMAAGYSIRPFGLGSRSSIAFCFLFIILFFYLTTKINSYKLRSTIIVAVTISSTISLLMEGMDWARSWELQQSIVASFPVDKIIPSESSLIIALVPTYSGHVTIFEDTWTLPKAIKLAHNLKLNIIPHKNEGFRKSELIIKDGKISTTSLLSGHPGVSSEYLNYYLWNYYTNKMYHIIGDLKIPVDVDYNDFFQSNLVEI